MNTAERHRCILDLLRDEGRADVARIVEMTNASAVTVRRDLEQLAAAGALRRVRGGAVSSVLRGEGAPFQLRRHDDEALKARLAAAAVALLQDGEAVAVDSGTTGAACAAALSSRRVTAVPMSLQGLQHLSDAGSVIVPGGEFDPIEGTFTGPLLEQNFAALRLDTMLMSCCGIGLDTGVTAYGLRDAAAKQAAHRSATRTILVAESKKFTRTALAYVCRLDEIDTIVTDTALPPNMLELCHNTGITLELVPHHGSPAPIDIQS